VDCRTGVRTQGLSTEDIFANLSASLSLRKRNSTRAAT
jgi:hypothetical protein